MVRYPIGQQDFKGIREEGSVYVDKTHYISRLLDAGKYFFLTRPRRFGKSLFLSTLDYFFKGERHLFKGLAIDSYSWDWEEYPVIHIDFGASSYENENNLHAILNRILERYEKQYGVTESKEKDPSNRLSRLIEDAYHNTGRKVVVLIDEYDKPVIDNIDRKELRDRFMELLRGFYGVLKSYDRYLKFVFLTGITKFGKLSVFSQLNNLRDISFLSPYSAICGITEKELRENFQDGINELAVALNTDYEGTINILKKNYDGYHFCEDCPDIFNPYSLLNCLADKRIRPYWFATGTPAMLAKLLVEKNYNLEDLDGIKTTLSNLMDISNEFDNPIPLFYQTGYLTIKSYNEVLNAYTLGFPNLEVEVAFFNFILPYYLNSKAKKADSLIFDFVDGILSGDPDKAMKKLESFTAGINYDMIPTPEVERHFQLIVYILSRLILPYTSEVSVEDHTSDGRIDLLIKTDKFIYIIEIKRDASPETALQQIEDKSYYLKFSSEEKTIFCIGVNFSTSQGRIEGFKIKKY